MSAPKHTPGPWFIGGRIAGLREDHIGVFGGRDLGVAVMNIARAGAAGARAAIAKARGGE